MTEPTIRDEWVEKAVRALVDSGLADDDGDGYILENVYAQGAVHTVLTAVADDIRADALQAAATAYQWGGWATLPQAAGNLAVKRQQAEHAVAWLRDRADRIGGAA